MVYYWTKSVPDSIYGLVLFNDILSGLRRDDKRRWQERHPRKQTGPYRLNGFFEPCIFHFFPDRLSLYTFHPISRGRHGCPKFRDDECSLWRRAVLSLKSYGYVSCLAPWPCIPRRWRRKDRLFQFSECLWFNTCPLFSSRVKSFFLFFLLEREIPLRHLALHAMPRSVSIKKVQVELRHRKNANLNRGIWVPREF